MANYLFMRSLSLRRQPYYRLKEFGLFLGKLILLALPPLIYGRTMAPTVYALDSAELAAGAYTLGLIHATGYPLYLLIGHLFTYLPLGDIGFRLNLMSAFFGQLTLLLLYHLLGRLGVRPVSALLAVLALAFSYYFWVLNLIAEVYTLHTFLIVAQLVCLKYWQDTGQDRWLYGLVGLCGLGLGNHLTIVLFMPGLVYIILRRRPDLIYAWRKLAWGLFFFALGASIYLYIPLRFKADPVMNYPKDYYQVNLATWQGMWWLLSGKMFGPAFFAYTPAEIAKEVLAFIHRLLGNFLGWGAAVGSIGFLFGVRRQSVWGVGTGLIFIANTIFFINYRVTDKEMMFLPLFLIWALWLGWGLEALYQWFSLAQRPGRRFVFSSLGVGFIVATFFFNYPRVDLSHDWQVRQQAEKMMQSLDERAYFIGRWGYVPTLEYLQIVEGWRPDVRLVHRVLLSDEQLEALVNTEIAHRPIYLSDIEPALSDHYRFQFIKNCLCFKVERRYSWLFNWLKWLKTIP